LIYVDTSVLAAYYCPEPLSVLAQQALERENDRAVSWLTEVELASALPRKARMREMLWPDVRRLLAVFQSHLEQGIYTRLFLDGAHFTKAREWLAASAISLQTLDALHLAVASLRGCPVLTADAAIAQACHTVGVTARLVALKS
jgi:predicted nucleic acid-binding protein